MSAYITLTVHSKCTDILLMRKKLRVYPNAYTWHYFFEIFAGIWYQLDSDDSDFQPEHKRFTSAAAEALMLRLEV